MIDLSRPGIWISGDKGRLGQALRAAAAGPIDGWDQPDLDLDEPATGAALVRRHQPRLVIHTAAMTAVDQAAREPEVALRRNGEAVAGIAAACREVGAGLVFVSTNEVFGGDRDDGIPYVEDDPTGPRNAYARSKLAGERAAQAAFGKERGPVDRADGVALRAARATTSPPRSPRQRTRRTGPLPVVSDEFGCPTYAPDLARAILGLVERTSGGVFHLVNEGYASRLDWAQAVLDVRRPGHALKPIAMAEFERASDPPLWGVLDTTKARSAGVVLRPWADALAEYLGS